MYQDRISPKIKNQLYGNYKIKLKRENDGSQFKYFNISHLAEDGANVFRSQSIQDLAIGDAVIGILVDLEDTVYGKFSGMVVWKEEGNLGLKFFDEMALPEQIIAMEWATMGS